MFTTSGYFRGVSCPFFLSGLCERPYCHFRHVKSDLKEKNNISGTSDSYLDGLTDLSYSGPSTSRCLNQIESDIKKERKLLQETESQHGHGPLSENKLPAKPQEQPLKINKYTGKPISPSNEIKTNKCNKFNKYTGKLIVQTESSTNFYKNDATKKKSKYSIEPQHSASVSNIVSTMGAVPEYNPTPICELKKRHVGSRKYSLSHADTPLSEQEYDPLVNYTTSFSSCGAKSQDKLSNMKKAHSYHGEFSHSDFEHTSINYKMADFGFSESEEEGGEEENGKWPYYKNPQDDLDEKNFEFKNVSFNLGDSDSDREDNLMIAESDGKATDSETASIDSPLKKNKNILSLKNTERTRLNGESEKVKHADNDILENGLKNINELEANSTHDTCSGKKNISKKNTKHEPVTSEEKENGENKSGQTFSLLSVMSQNMKCLTKGSSKDKLVKTGDRVTLMKLNSLEHLKKTTSAGDECNHKNDSLLEESVVHCTKTENNANLSSDARALCTDDFKIKKKSRSSTSCDSRRSSTDSDRSKSDSSKSHKSHSEKSHSSKSKPENFVSSNLSRTAHSDKTKALIEKSGEKIRTKDVEKSRSKKDSVEKSSISTHSRKTKDEKSKSNKDRSISSHSDKVKSHKHSGDHTVHSSTLQSTSSSKINSHSDKTLPHEKVSVKVEVSSSRPEKSHGDDKPKFSENKDSHSKSKDIHKHSDKNGKVTDKHKSGHFKHSTDHKYQHSGSSRNKHSEHKHDHPDSSRKRKSDSTDDDPIPKHVKKMQDNVEDVIVINSSPEKDTTQKDKQVSLSKSPTKTIADINIDLFGEDSDDGGCDARVKNFSDMSDSELCQYLSDSDFEDMNTYDECLKIFNEGSAKLSSSKVKSEKKVIPENSVDDLPTVIGKKRVAHHSSVEVAKKVPERPFNRLSAAQVMHNRFAELHRRAQEAADKKALTEKSSKAGIDANQTGKKRLAHQPIGLQGLSQAKKKTNSITASKTEKRIAHTPTVNLKRPTIPAEFGSKVPSVIRQRYLNTIIDECLKICRSTEEAFKKGQEEEMIVYNRSSSKTVYLNVAVNTIKRLRTEAAASVPQSSKQKINLSPLKISHEAVLGGKGAAMTSFTLNRSGSASKVNVEDFKGSDLYNHLKLYVLTETQLRENGYPRPSTESGGFAVFYTDEMKVKQKVESNLSGSPGSKQKVCIRCGTRFTIFPNGKYAKVEECIFHWGKAWKKRVDRSIESRYNCCQGDLEAKGCQMAKGHVHESNKKENLKGYMRTIPSSPPVDGDYGVYALDCEMVYTTGGLELARVTVVTADLTPIYETFIKPDNPVVDYNTRFSGITEKDLNGVKTTLHDVQAVLLSLFTSQTILLGHSLESDFIALKLIHDTVVDTSVVFPHRLGPPYKRALRNLMSEHLKKIIQDDVGGHDSLEDARACLELMQWKLKEVFRKGFH